MSLSAPTPKNTESPRRRRASGRRRGFTLIEIMVVIVLMALFAGGATIGLRALTKSRLRQACMTLVAASRYSYDRAIIQSSTTRIALDLDQGMIAIEEAPGFVTLAVNDDARRANTDETDGDHAAVDPWAAARARLENTHGPTLGRSPFGPIVGNGGTPLRQYQARPLNDGIRVVRVITPHEIDPRQSGTASIYFFPGGLGEHAVIQLADPSDTVYSVEIQALTGRAIVHDFAFEPEELSDEDVDELRDPG